MTRNCCPSYFSNFISLVPNEKDITIEVTSETGWYTLYTPSNSTIQQIPIPVYHTRGVADYTGWTTRVPLSCTGNTNYATGRCTLVHARVEEAPTPWLKDGYSSVNKTEIILVGRCVYPKVTSLLQFYPETYCFYTIRQFKTKDISPFTPTMAQENWYLGFASYREIPAQVLVSEKVFGTPVNLDLRAIGKYKGVLDSYRTQTVADPANLLMATTVPKQPFENVAQVYWKAATQSFSVIFNGKVATISLVFSNPVAGSLLTNGTQVVEEVVPSKAWKITTTPGFTNLNISLAGVISPPNTVVTVAIGNQITEIQL